MQEHFELVDISTSDEPWRALFEEGDIWTLQEGGVQK
jgi:hypothetical protein